MSHFAKVCDGKVINVIVAEKEFFDTFIDTSAGTWIQTSYNTYGNKHLAGGTPLRGNYASVGYTYDAVNDVFIAPKPYQSWILSADYLWESPIAYPTDGAYYTWDEATLNWIAVLTENLIKV